MNREQRLEYCQQCTKRGFSPKKGVVCSLTNEHAAFEDTCPDFEADPKVVHQYKKEQEVKQAAQQKEDTMGLSQFGVKNGFIAGIIVMAAAILWFVLGLVYLNRIFFYPLILFGFGVFIMAKGANKQREERENNTDDDSLLDSEL